MFTIGDYLKKNGNFPQKGREERVVVVAVIQEVARVNVALRDVEINNSTAFVRVSGAPKMEILMHKDAILERLKQELGEKAPKEIR